MAANCRNTALLAILTIALVGCASTPQPPSENGGIFRERNEGYSLLYKLMGDESQVGGIFIVKSADDPVKSLVKEIGNFCDVAKKQMDDFPKTDNRVEYDVPDLPPMEQKSRDLTARQDTKALLGSGGSDFALRLIFTQAQAMDYGAQLANAMLDIETDPARKTFLSNVAQHCTDYHDRLMAFLTVKS